MSDTTLTEIHVDGMTCTNCAASVQKRLEKQGLANVNVNFATGEVIFKNLSNLPLESISESIEDLGYKVTLPNQTVTEKKNF
ncbi:MAG: heavy-metal-associated domain-containing protein [Bacteroidia bacterium]